MASFISLAIFSIALSLLCLCIIFVSFSGHPIWGLWIFILSLIGAPAFLYLSMLFWRIRRFPIGTSIHGEMGMTAGKILIFLMSLVVALICFAGLSMSLAMSLIFLTDMPRWASDIVYAASFIASAIIGWFIFRRSLERWGLSSSKN